MLPQNPARSRSRGVFYGLCFLFSCQIAQAQPAEPFATHDQNPLVAVYGLPSPVNARLLATGDSRWLTSLNITNTLNVDHSASRELIVDAETKQLNLVYEYGFRQDWLLRLQFSASHHNAGYFDSWIYDFHDLLGFKQGYRTLIPDDQFRIYVSDNGNPLLDLQTAQTGLGDTQVQLGRQITADTTSASSLWLSLKLPTGDSARLTGSGHADFALWLAMQQQFGDSIWLHGQLGGLYMSDTDILPTLHKQTAGLGNLGLNYAWSDSLQLKAQLDMHSPLYNSQLHFLDTAIQLTFGGTKAISKKHTIDVAMSEDIQTGTSPDVTLNITWAIQF